MDTVQTQCDKSNRGLGMNTQRINDTDATRPVSNRGVFMCSVIARIDERGRQVEWWSAPSNWAAVEWVKQTLAVAPGSKFGVSDQYLYPCVA